jgi:hypothetical protein
MVLLPLLSFLYSLIFTILTLFNILTELVQGDLREGCVILDEIHHLVAELPGSALPCRAGQCGRSSHPAVWQPGKSQDRAPVWKGESLMACTRVGHPRMPFSKQARAGPAFGKRVRGFLLTEGQIFPGVPSPRTPRIVPDPQLFPVFCCAMILKSSCSIQFPYC